MIDTIYIEEQVLDHPRTQQILTRFPKADHIVVDRYGEVFNSHTQNFRVQKQNPALVLAHKANTRVHPTPAQYETGGGANYYFSHMLNCLYDCRYCFLQGMFRSANYLLFVNYEDFMTDIEAVALQHRQDDKPAWFFSGYDCDSLALEPVTGFADYFLDKFQSVDNAILELRTKSTQIRSLLSRPALPNVVVAYSLSPDAVANSIEAGAPSVAKRIQALARLQAEGWRIGLRFDPIIWHQNYQESYSQLFTDVFESIDVSKVDSITLGGFRLPKGFYKTMRKLYPEHWLFSAGLSESEGTISYSQEIEREMFSALGEELNTHAPTEKIYQYPSQAA